MNAKRFISAVLSAALCLSLAACSEKADSDKDMGANSDNSTTTTTAADTTTTTEAEVNEPIKLTTENWQDFFEIRMVEEIEYEDDGTIDRPVLYPTIFPKEGYQFLEGEENEVEITFSATGVWRYIYLDTQTLEVEIGDVVADKESEAIGDGELSAFFTHGDEGGYCWLTGIVTYGAGYVTDIGDYSEDTLFHFLDGWYWNDKLEAMALKIPIQQIPENFVCTSVTGCVIPVE